MVLHTPTAQSVVPGLQASLGAEFQAPSDALSWDLPSSWPRGNPCTHPKMRSPSLQIKRADDVQESHYAM